MGQQNMVRGPLEVRERTSRTLDQRLAIRFPAVAALGGRLLARLPPGSGLRARSVRIAIEAYNRRDLLAASVAFHPDLEYYPYREFVEAGLAEPCYHGPEGYRAYITATYDVWGNDVLLKPTEVIDLGDRFVLLADMPMRAQASGIALAQTDSWSQNPSRWCAAWRTAASWSSTARSPGRAARRAAARAVGHAPQRRAGLARPAAARLPADRLRRARPRGLLPGARATPIRA